MSYYREKKEVLVGEKFNGFTVIDVLSTTRILVRCDCGAVSEEDKMTIVYGSKKSCKNLACKRKWRKKKEKQKQILEKADYFIIFYDLLNQNNALDLPECKKFLILCKDKLLKEVENIDDLIDEYLALSDIKLYQILTQRSKYLNKTKFK